MVGLLFFFTLFFFNWRVIAYSAVLASAIYWRESAIAMHMSSPSWISCPPLKVEGSIETYVLPYVKLDSGNVLYDTGSSNHALITRVLLLIYVFKEEGWDGSEMSSIVFTWLLSSYRVPCLLWSLPRVPLYWFLKNVIRTNSWSIFFTQIKQGILKTDKIHILNILC